MSEINRTERGFERRMDNQRPALLDEFGKSGQVFNRERIWNAAWVYFYGFMPASGWCDLEDVL